MTDPVLVAWIVGMACGFAIGFGLGFVHGVKASGGKDDGSI